MNIRFKPVYTDTGAAEVYYHALWIDVTVQKITDMRYMDRHNYASAIVSHGVWIRGLKSYFAFLSFYVDFFLCGGQWRLVIRGGLTYKTTKM
jgi:hypothetical protein